jgi:hypothetical protein
VEALLKQWWSLAATKETAFVFPSAFYNKKNRVGKTDQG